jgi:excisionase family DNA binding protein
VIRLVSIPRMATDYLDVGRSTAYELVAAGEIRTVSIGARKLVPEDEIEAYIARLRDAAGIPERATTPAANAEAVASSLTLVRGDRRGPS